MEKSQLIKSHNHDHFWIEDNILFESYKTIRGLRYRSIMEVMLQDNDKLSESEIEFINKSYFGKVG